MSISDRCPLFEGVEEEMLRMILERIPARKHTYGRGQVLVQKGPEYPAAVVLSGQVNTSFLDYQGRETTVAHIQTGQAFWLAESTSCKATEFTYTAVEKTEVLLFETRRLYDEDVLTLPGTGRILKNMQNLIAGLAINMSRKISILSRHTLEEKMLAMLEYFGIPTNEKNVIEMPLNRERTAEYLMADRSALSYCLMKMKKKGLIDYHRNLFRLLYKTEK